jgi:predicted Zn finger-like uncharacterized protein
MITTCTGCQTRYRLDVDKVPRRVVRVRCPGCATVFELDGTAAARPEPAAPTPPPAAEGAGSATAAPPPVVESPPPAPAAETPPPAAPEPGIAPAAEPAAAQPGAEKVARPVASQPTAGAEPTPLDTAVAVEDSPAAPTKRRSRDKARMLARALVSDILVYNREQRDKALEEGNLLEALGAEIKKSWELYKEKVGEETANGTTHFRDALNEILADGERVF